MACEKIRPLKPYLLPSSKTIFESNFFVSAIKSLALILFNTDKVSVFTLLSPNYPLD